MSDIAKLYDTTVNEILALNPDVDPELIKPDQVLLVPAATPPPGANQPGAETTPGPFVVHVVETGETLIAIAEQYGIPVALIRTANDLAPEEETIQTGQSLIIPRPTPTPNASPTAIPDITSTPVTRYAAPALLSPPDGALFAGGEAPIMLQWASVSVLRESEWYQLSLSQPSGGVVSSTVRTRATAWRVPLDLLQRAEADAPEFQWHVRVVREVGDEIYEQAGASSAVRSFTWQAPMPTPTSPGTPTP
jgi:LysM repeat protein